MNSYSALRKRSLDSKKKISSVPAYGAHLLHLTGVQTLNSSLCSPAAMMLYYHGSLYDPHLDGEEGEKGAHTVDCCAQQD